MDEVLVSDLLERGRVSYAKRAWLDAHESLSRADDVDSLEPASQPAAVRSTAVRRARSWTRILTPLAR